MQDCVGTVSLEGHSTQQKDFLFPSLNEGGGFQKKIYSWAAVGALASVTYFQGMAAIKAGI